MNDFQKRAYDAGVSQCFVDHGLRKAADDYSDATGGPPPKKPRRIETDEGRMEREHKERNSRTPYDDPKAPPRQHPKTAEFDYGALLKNPQLMAMAGAGLGGGAGGLAGYAAGGHTAAGAAGGAGLGGLAGYLGSRYARGDFDPSTFMDPEYGEKYLEGDSSRELRKNMSGDEWQAFRDRINGIVDETHGEMDEEGWSGMAGRMYDSADKQIDEKGWGGFARDVWNDK